MLACHIVDSYPFQHCDFVSYTLVNTPVNPRSMSTIFVYIKETFPNAINSFYDYKNAFYYHCYTTKTINYGNQCLRDCCLSGVVELCVQIVHTFLSHALLITEIKGVFLSFLITN